MFLYCIVFTAQSSTTCVKTDDNQFRSALKYDWRLTYQNSFDVVNSPLHGSLRDWIIVGSVLGATAISIQFDSKVRTFAKSHQSDNCDPFFRIGRQYGSAAMILSISAGCYAAGFGFKDPWLRETGREIFVAGVMAGLTTGILKATCGRSRPYLKNGPFRFKPFTLSNSNQSFPSGHTTDAFVLSTVLALRIKNPAVSCLLYGLALLTASQRIYDDKHWLSDCVMAACIGTSMGIFIVHDSEKITIQSDKRWGVIPLVTPYGKGLTVNIKL